MRYYFLGVDPAPAQGQSNDDGALSVLRAIPTVEEPENESDFQLDFIYDRVARGLDAAGWSGLIHEKQRDFGFSMIVMDWGGGGQWVWPELVKKRQVIQGVETQCRPIASRDSELLDAANILCFVLRRDSGMQTLWKEPLANAQGDDVLKSLMHVAFREAWAKGLFGVPERHETLIQKLNPDGSKFIAGWPEERIWSSVMNSRALDEMAKFSAATRPDGSWDITKNGAHKFVSTLRDDLVFSRSNAFTGFRIWWTQESEGGFGISKEDESMVA